MAKPTTARRSPTCVPTVMALLDFDDEVDEGALPVANPELEEEPEPEPVVLDDETKPTGSSSCCHSQYDHLVGGERRGMLVQGLYVQS